MRRIIIFLLVFSFSLFAQNNIEQVRDKIAEINIGLLNSQPPSINQINDLRNLLNDSDNKEIGLSRTSKKLNEFNAFLMNENNIDSLKIVFREVNNQVNTDAGNYFYDKLLKSNKSKILVLSTTISCECTLEMCYQQETEVQKFCKENDYDYAVIDTWTDTDIQNKYNAGFVPTIIVLGKKNSVINQFSRSDKLVELLNQLINK